MLSQARDAPELAVLDDVALRVTAGAPLPPAGRLPARCRRAVAIAAIVGSPILDAIDASRSAEEDAAEARRAVGVASSQARAVATALLAAPFLVTPLLAGIVDIDLTTFFSSSVGVLVLAVAGVLYLAGAALVVLLVRRTSSPGASGRGSPPGSILAGGAAAVVAWTLVGALAAPFAGVLAYRVAARRAAAPAVPDADEAVDLVATALHGAASVPQALRLVADQLPAFAGELSRLAWHLQTGHRTPGTGADVPRTEARAAGSGPSRAVTAIPRLADVLVTAEQTGAAVAPTLRRLASQLRADQLAERLAAAERLPAHLTFPTALFLLPATVLVIGAPIVHAGWSVAGW